MLGRAPARRAGVHYQYESDMRGESMSTKQCAVGTVVGGIVTFGLGYLIFDMLLGDFYAANGGSATGVEKDPPLYWSLAVGALAYAALIVYAMKSQAASANVTSGMKVGAVVGFLIWACADFTFYGGTNIGNLTITVVDPLVEIVRGGIVGAVLGAVLPKLA